MRRIGYVWAFALIILVSFNLSAKDTDNEQAWTWLYYKTLDHSAQNSRKSELLFSKENIPLFTQLIFSWNGLRPSKGYFSFWVSARDAKSKRWGKWHRMIDWGAGVQRSYLSKSRDYFSKYHHVRLEIHDTVGADGFKIRIASHDHGDVTNLKAFSVSLSNFNDFQAEDVRNCASLHSVHVEGVPKLSQFLLDHPKNDTLCSPTSCTMLSSFLLGQDVDPLQFADRVYDQGLEVYGSWPFNMAHAFELCKGEFLFFTARLNSFARLHQRLRQGIPVVVSVRGHLKGAALPYKSGHLLVVVGWDAKKQEVICHDPAFKDIKEVVQRYAVKDFITAWERSRRLAYIVEPRTS